MHKLQQALGYAFKDPSHLRLALTHPSTKLPDNQRLEFLGDAVLEFCVSDMLYRKYPDLHEGELTARRAALVCERTLSAVARSLELGRYLLMGHGEEQPGGRAKPSILAAAMQAVLPADSYEQVEYTGGNALVTAVYKAGDAGYVVQVKPATSFSGNLTVMVGVGTDGACTGISIVKTGETSGLGSNASKPDWPAQFVGKTGEGKVTKDGGDINAITGATITSRGVSEAVTSAIAAAASMG